MPESDDIPNGLVLFSSGTSPERRKRRLAFIGVMLAALVALIWPVYPIFGDVRPLILGLPLSLAWVILWLAISFGALVWLYRAES